MSNPDAILNHKALVAVLRSRGRSNSAHDIRRAADTIEALQADLARRDAALLALVRSIKKDTESDRKYSSATYQYASNADRILQKSARQARTAAEAGIGGDEQLAANETQTQSESSNTGKLAEIISDADIVRVHGSANFGPTMTPREVVNDGVRKYAVGYSSGHTQLCILLEHGLITKPRPGRYEASLTKKGKRYARALMHDALFGRAALSPTPAPDTGEAVAWRWEENSFNAWKPRLTDERPTDGPRVRKVRPLYASNNLEEVERLSGLLGRLLANLDALDDYMKQPDRGGYGVECAVCMNEWLEPEDRAVMEEARALLASQALGGKRDV